MSDALKQVELDIASGSADVFGVAHRDHIVDRLVSRAVPDLDGAGRNDDLFTGRVGKGANFVRIEADSVPLVPFLGGKTVRDRYALAR